MWVWLDITRPAGTYGGGTERVQYYLNPLSAPDSVNGTKLSLNYTTVHEVRIEKFVDGEWVRVLGTTANGNGQATDTAVRRLEISGLGATTLETVEFKYRPADNAAAQYQSLTATRMGAGWYATLINNFLL